MTEKDDVEGDDVKRGSETESNLNMAAYLPEKDDVEGDDVKRGSETESNLNMAVYYHKLGSPQVMRPFFPHCF
ncbi:hypothetical protein T484DRAFT_1831192 [Baffinella frigidus]|nr:hypothetical protein T484DRAFT_1831192 [Cryptophyta sp. CCMP2293]